MHVQMQHRNEKHMRQDFESDRKSSAPFNPPVRGRLLVHYSYFEDADAQPDEYDDDESAVTALSPSGHHARKSNGIGR